MIFKLANKKHVKEKKFIYFLNKVLFLTILPFSTVFALGMGALNTDSFIGERLSLHIPIFNVLEPDDLEVLIQGADSNGAFLPLSAAVEKSNSQLGIRIVSDRPVGEPYINLSIELIDEGDSVSREYAVLLDLGATSSATVNNKATSSSVPLSDPVVTNLNRQVSNSDIMGPYDWAKAGQVAPSFGPVLDGQSLWRVARRINKALGVSVDQMMWSLYQNNRNQFSSDSITSLKAGAILKIPSAEQASQISELQAKANVIKFSASQVSNPAPKAETVSSVKSEAEQPITQGNVKEVQDFQLTGLEASDGSGKSDLVSSDAKSQEIIASLAEAVGSLTQEVIKKDRKIAFLEEKVTALEQYAKINASDLKLDSSEETAVVEGDKIKHEIEAQVDVAPLSFNEDVKSNQGVNSSFEFKAWYWFLIILVVLLLAMFLFRKQLLALVSSLNLFQSKNEIEFDPSEYHHPETELSVFPIDADATVENASIQNGLSQKSILSAIKEAVQDDDGLSPQTIMELDGEFSYTEMQSVNNELSTNEADLGYVDRFNKALSKHDYGFALQLLDMGRDVEINQADYHYNRLKMYEVMHDEDAFYDYFCEVENEMPEFPTEVQTKISQLVLKMSQR